eukprot:CAMPEP_0194280494 /NCGR_PEP_ID=MMETSP0169-20130528/17661_1 /TAXON_ID=218684 /ORGANISM="Corethron pennatum, Strain L29A3" /LENGTH=218 /DNA_ID=CAMNT_0039025237 /DNA_START=84 /DNA_END=737 /DNA_ORIENTATION=-
MSSRAAAVSVVSSTAAKFMSNPSLALPSQISTRKMGMTSAQRRVMRRLQQQKNQGDSASSSTSSRPANFATQSGPSSGPPPVSRGSADTRTRNMATAAGLTCFVGGVWYYCVSAVGGKGGGDAIDEIDEAIEARRAKEDVLKIHAHKDGLKATLEETTVIGKRGQGMEGKKESENKAHDNPVQLGKEAFLSERSDQGVVKGETKRPIWKRVVFFWRRD